MAKNIMIVAVLSVLIFVVTPDGYAQLIDWSRRQGTPPAAPASAPVRQRAVSTPSQPTVAPTRQPGWLQTAPSVSSRTDRRYDVNRDGKLQSAEIKVFLRDVIDQISRRGSYKVDSQLLEEYDKNNDGIIDRSEVRDLVGDVK